MKIQIKDADIVSKIKEIARRSGDSITEIVTSVLTEEFTLNELFDALEDETVYCGACGSVQNDDSEGQSNEHDEWFCDGCICSECGVQDDDRDDNGLCGNCQPEDEE